MKKLLWFLVLTFLIFTGFLISGNIETIVNVIVTFAEGKIFWYLLGAATMFTANLISGGTVHLPRGKSKK